MVQLLARRRRLPPATRRRPVNHAQHCAEWELMDRVPGQDLCGDIEAGLIARLADDRPLASAIRGRRVAAVEARPCVATYTLASGKIDLGQDSQMAAPMLVASRLTLWGDPYWAQIGTGRDGDEHYRC